MLWAFGCICPASIFSLCCCFLGCCCNSSFYRKIDSVLFINQKRQISAPAVGAQANPPFAVSDAIWRCHWLFRVQVGVGFLQLTISKALTLDKTIQTTSDHLQPQGFQESALLCYNLCDFGNSRLGSPSVESSFCWGITGVAAVSKRVPVWDTLAMKMPFSGRDNPVLSLCVHSEVD